MRSPVGRLDVRVRMMLSLKVWAIPLETLIRTPIMRNKSV